MSKSDWDLDALRSSGFEGFVTFSELPTSPVPRVAGVYLVLRSATSAPSFRESSPAGRPKDRNPSVEPATLRRAWVDGAHVLYIGKATTGSTNRRGLRRRLDEYRRHGAGEPVGHWGGRYIWQLRDSTDLLVAWRETPAVDAEAIESAMIAAFMEDWGRRPFANLKSGGRVIA